MSTIAVTKRRKLVANFHKNRGLYLLALPALVWFVLFAYFPMAGRVLAFMDFNPIRGFFGSEWVGLENFRRLFSEPDLPLILRNTLVISLMRFIVFPVPLILALLINEVSNAPFRRTVQTVIYFPHFISWPIVASITLQILDLNNGLFTNLVVALGGERQLWLGDGDAFRLVLVFQTMWKEAGWGTILYLATIAGISPHLYEAAAIDGCNRFQRTLYVTFPPVMKLAIILVILSIGRIINENFQQILLMINPLVYDKGEVFETFIFRKGIMGGEFEYTTAVGIFKALVAFVMVYGANKIAKRFGHRGLY